MNRTQNTIIRRSPARPPNKNKNKTKVFPGETRKETQKEHSVVHIQTSNKDLMSALEQYDSNTPSRWDQGYDFIVSSVGKHKLATIAVITSSSLALCSYLLVCLHSHLEGSLYFDDSKHLNETSDNETSSPVNDARLSMILPLIAGVTFLTHKILSRISSIDSPSPKKEITEKLDKRDEKIEYAIYCYCYRAYYPIPDEGSLAYHKSSVLMQLGQSEDQESNTALVEAVIKSFAAKKPASSTSRSLFVSSDTYSDDSTYGSPTNSGSGSGSDTDRDYKTTFH